MFYSLMLLEKYKKQIRRINNQNALVSMVADNWGITKRAARDYLNMFKNQKTK